MEAVISNSFFFLIFSAVTEQPYQDFLSSFLPSSSKEAPDKNTSSQRAFMRVSMGLTDRRKTAKNLVDSRKNWKILTVSRK